MTPPARKEAVNDFNDEVIYNTQINNTKRKNVRDGSFGADNRLPLVLKPHQITITKSPNKQHQNFINSNKDINPLIEKSPEKQEE